MHLCCKNIIHTLQFLDVSLTFQRKPECPRHLKRSAHTFAALSLGAAKGLRSSKPAAKGVARELRMTLIQILLQTPLE